MLIIGLPGPFTERLCHTHLIHSELQVTEAGSQGKGGSINALMIQDIIGLRVRNAIIIWNQCCNATAPEC